MTVWTAADLELEPDRLGLNGSATVVAGVGRATGSERKRQRVAGSPDQEAEALVSRMLAASH